MGHFRVGDGLLVAVRMDVVARVTILRMAVSLAHGRSAKSHRYERGRLYKVSIACSSPSSAVIKRGHFRDSAGLARRVTPE